MKSLIFIVNEIVTNRIKPGLPACLLGLVADVSVLQGRGTPSVEMAEKLGSTVSSMKEMVFMHADDK